MQSKWGHLISSSWSPDAWVAEHRASPIPLTTQNWLSVASSPILHSLSQGKESLERIGSLPTCIAGEFCFIHILVLHQNGGGYSEDKCNEVTSLSSADNSSGSSINPLGSALYFLFVSQVDWMFITGCTFSHSTRVLPTGSVDTTPLDTHVEKNASEPASSVSG